MSIFPIRTFGDPVLRIVAEPITEIDASIERLAADMLETMYDAPGVGLAAPQIGVSKQIFVFDIGEGPHVVVNPVLIEALDSWTFEEGCLSVPGKWWPIKRSAFARVRGLDLDGNEVEHEGDELMGRVLQHEVDHLHGTLLIERLSKRVRRQALRELREEALGLGAEG